MLGEEAEYKTFHTSLLDSSPGASFIPLTHSTEGGNEWGKDVIPVDSAQVFSFLVTQRPCLSHPSLLLTSTHQIPIRDDRSQCMHV